MLGLLITIIAAIYYIPWYLKLVTRWLHQYPMVVKLPGPKGYPLIGNVIDLAGGTDVPMKFWLKEAENARKRGQNQFTLTVLGRVITFPLDGKASKAILESQEELRKGSDYEYLRAWVGDGMLLAIGQQWRDRRRLFTPMFHFAMLEGYMETFNKHARIMMDVVRNYDGKPVDMGNMIKLCSLDIICDAAMGGDFGTQLNPSHPYVEAVDVFTHYSQRYNVEPQMWVTAIWYLLYHREYKQALDELNRLTEQLINKRVKAIKAGEVDLSEKRKPVIDIFFAQQETMKMTDRELHYEINATIFGGHDTTAASLTWIFWSLATQPHFQKQVRDEIISIFGDSDRDCTKEDMKKMEFTERFIKESMRIFSPVPFVERELDHDFKQGDYMLPKGSDIFISPFLIHHNEEIYPEPWKFDPDRFLPENCEGRHPYDYIPFVAGARNCLGQKFAMYEMKVIVSWAMRNFSFTCDLGLLDNGYATEVVLKPTKGCVLNVKSRNCKEYMEMTS